jgi:hypothetical protein
VVASLLRGCLVVALVVLASSAHAGNICVSAVGNNERAERLANAFCTNDPGVASGFEVKLRDDVTVVRISLLPARLALVAADADALKIAAAYGTALLPLGKPVYIAFVPVRLGNDRPVKIVLLEQGKAPQLVQP